MLSLSGGQEAPARMEDQPLLNMLAVVLLLSVLWRINGQNISITQHPRNDTFCEGSTALLSCTVFDNTTGNTANSTGWFRDGNPPVLLSSNVINNTRNGNVVTSVLSVENVDNGDGYFCLPAFGVISYVGVILVVDLPTATNIRPVSEICVTSFNISWDVSNSITCGDVSYEVSISPPPIEGNAIATTDNMFYSVTGLNNSLPNVTIIVTAISNRGGRGNNRTILVELSKPLDPPPVYNTTISSSITPADLSGFDIIISWTRPTIDPCTTLPITGYFIHAIVTRRNANERIYTSKYIDDMLGGTMGEFSVSYNASFEQDLEPNANYIFIVNTQNNVLEISRTDTRPSCNCTDESDDELSTGAAVAISIVVTFIIILVVTALISVIITSLYYKHLFKKSLIRQEGNSHALTEDIKGNDPAYATTRANITMDTNPAYGTATTIKMDPAYASY